MPLKGTHSELPSSRSRGLRFAGRALKMSRTVWAIISGDGAIFRGLLEGIGSKECILMQVVRVTAVDDCDIVLGGSDQ